MTKSKKILIGLLMSISMTANPIFIDSVDNSLLTSATEITPYASSVFDSYSGTVTTTACYADAHLCNYGNVTITVILQKKNILGNWSNYKTDDPGQTYTNVTDAYHSYKYSITSSGTYRCKYTIKGTVGNITETKTSYSNILTVN